MTFDESSNWLVLFSCRSSEATDDCRLIINLFNSEVVRNANERNTTLHSVSDVCPRLLTLITGKIFQLPLVFKD